jgi:hypothetical protein
MVDQERDNEQAKEAVIGIFMLYKEEEAFVLDIFKIFLKKLEEKNKWYWYDLASEIYFDQVLKMVR